MAVISSKVPEGARQEAPEAARSADLERSFSQVIESAPNGVVVIDSSGRIVLVNRELERMFGYSRSNLLNQPIERLLPEPFRATHSGMRMSYFMDPRPRAMGSGRELFGLRADGTEFPVEIGLNGIETSAGPMAVATIADISARRHAEANFHNLVEAAPYGMVVVDQTGTIVLVNSRMELIFGYSRAEMEGRPVEMLLPARYRAPHADHRDAYRAAPALRAMGTGRDFMALHENGTEFPVEVGLSPVEWKSDSMVLAAIIDISERKRLEFDLAQAKVNLEEFTHVASHDLRSPLRGIADLVEWIAEDLGDDPRPEIRKNLDRVRLRVRRLERIIDDLLAYARAGRASADIELIDPAALIDGVMEIQPIPPGFEIVVKVDAAPFKAARTPLETVLRNLVSNAIKHHDRDTGKIEIAVREDDAFCVVTVSDDGPGIPAKVQDRIFQLFQTLSASEREGSGIGLALGKRLVECHGGTITVQSADDRRGTSFQFRWPRFERKIEKGF
jgi:PAS domain S-box-containing protein